MIHSRLFNETEKFRNHNFQPSRDGFADEPMPMSQKLDPAKVYLDGREDVDRPLTVQFCANDPEELLNAARWVQPHCDAVDLNLGCPQGIARKGHYGAFLQEDWDLVYSLINKLHKELDVPVTAKIRVLETREKTLEYAKRIMEAGASILTVHGRLREQKGHLTGVADWQHIRYVRDNLPKEVVMFANGNILRHEDIARCLKVTGVDGVMSAEGNLADPTIFAERPAVGEEGREYWRGRDGRGGFRMDAVFRRYMDIIHQYVLEKPVPQRKPLFLPSDPPEAAEETLRQDVKDTTTDKGTKRPSDESEPPAKRRKRHYKHVPLDVPMSLNVTGMQAHLFQMLRALVSRHTHVRDALAQCRAGDIAGFENVLTMVEEVVKQGLLDYAKDPSKYEDAEDATSEAPKDGEEADIADGESSAAAVKACRRPFWVCQARIRPVPKEALAKGSINLSKKELKKLRQQEAEESTKDQDTSGETSNDAAPEGTGNLESAREKVNAADGLKREEIPKEAMVAG